MIEIDGHKPLCEFDILDPKNIGRPFFWTIDTHLEAINQMITADELKFALQMTEMLPGWYRDNYPQQFTQIRNWLLQQCYDDFDYASDFDEANWNYKDIVEQCLTNYTFPRANVVAEEIEKLNAIGERPWICELSTSHGWLPLGFQERGFQFDFYGKNLNQKALDKVKSFMNRSDKPAKWQDHAADGQKKWLVFFEAIEHMWDEYAFERSAKKLGITFDKIFLSTPKYTLGGGLPEWRNRRVGHVRTWTPKEFAHFADKIFSGYKWNYVDSHSMVLTGIR